MQAKQRSPVGALQQLPSGAWRLHHNPSTSIAPPSHSMHHVLPKKANHPNTAAVCLLQPWHEKASRSNVLLPAGATFMLLQLR